MSELLKLINSHVRHDILNDLTTIRSILEVYQDTKNDELLENALKKIDGSAEFLKEMKKVESMVSEGNLKPLNLSDALKSIQDKYEGYVNLNVQGDCTIIADDSVSSVFDNLIRNSITHGNADNVDIEITDKGEICQVEVADNGKGIPEDIKDSVFEKEVSTNGTGLGLYIVKKTVERYGGSIHLKDRQQGAKFVLLFNTPTTTQKQESRNSGISVLGEIGWGTHICHFYQTKDDLLEVLIPYFKAGLENNEYCIWVTSEFPKEEAQKLIKKRLTHNIEVISYEEWYNTDDTQQLIDSWAEKLNQSLAEGYDGLRVTGDAARLDNLKNFINYEEEIHRTIDDKVMIALCSYPFDRLKTSEIADLTSRHHYTLVVREGEWELIENFEHKKAQKVLQRVEEKYKALVENANEGIVVVQDEKIVYVNSRAMEVSGYSQEEMMFTPFSEFIHPDDREMVFNRYKERVSDVGTDSYQFRFIDKTGDIRWAEVKVASVEWDGKPATLNLLTDITAQKEAEEKLQELKTSYQELFDKSGDAIFIHDPDTAEILDVNQRMCELYDYSREEALNLKVGDLSAGEPYTNERAKEWVQKARTEGPQTFEWQGMKKDGTIFWEEVTLKKAIIGDTERILASVRDITERKQSEESLKGAWKKARESEKLYSTLVEKVNDMVFMLDSKGNVTFFNSYVKEHYSLNDDQAEKILGTHISFFWCDKSLNEVQNAVDKVIGERKEISIDCICEDRDYLLKITPLINSNELTGMVAVARDFSEHKQVEEALRQREKTLEDIVEGTPVPKFVVDNDHKVTYWNRACENLSGVNTEEVIGTTKQWYPWYHEERPTMADLIIDGNEEDLVQYYGGKQLRTSIIEGAYEAIDYFPHLGEDGKWLYFTACPLKDEEDRITGAIETIQDITEQKRAEENLKESEEKYRTYVDNSPVAIFVANAKGEYIDVNNAACEMLGYTKSEILNMSIPDLDKTEGVPLEDFEQLKSTGKYRNERKLQRKDGSLVDVDLNAVFLENGNFMAFCSDITEKRMAQKRLKESEARYRNLFNHSNYAILIHDLEGKIIDANQKSLELTGYSKSEMLALNVMDLAPLESTEDVEQKFNKISRDGYVNFEVDYLTKDSEVRYVEVSASTFESGGKTLVQSLVRDITDKKKYEQALKESEERYRQLVDSVTDIPYTMDVEGVITYLGPQVENYGYKVQEIVGRDFTEIIHPEDVEQVMYNLQWSLETGEEPPSEFRVHTPAMGVRWFEERGRLIKGGEGEIKRISGILRDVTEKRQAEEHVEHLNSLLMAIRNINQLIVQEQDLEKLMNESCRLLLEIRGYLGCSIALVNKDNSIVPVAGVGAGAEEPQFLGYVDASIEGEGVPECVKAVIETGELYIVYNKVCKSCAYREHVQGSCCSLVIPMKESSQIVGLFFVTLEKGVEISEDELSLLQEVIDDLVFARSKFKAEERLKESEERYRATFEHTGTAMIVIGEDTTIDMINKECEKLSGYKKEEIEGKKSWKDFVHPDDLERMLGYHSNRRKEDGMPNRYEFRLIDRKGNVRNVFITIDMIPGTKKSIASLLDVTHLRRLNRLLRVISETNEVVARIKKPEIVLDAVCRNLKLLYEDIFACVIRDGQPVPIKSEGVSTEAIKNVINKCPSVHRAMEGEAKEIPTDSELCQRCTEKTHKYAFSVPLTHKKQQGIITIHSNSDFSNEEATLLQKLASNIAFALSAYEVEQDKVTAMEQLAKNLSQFDMAADRLRNPLAVIMSALEIKERYGKEEILEVIQEQTERIKEELDELRKEESTTYELFEKSKP